MLRCNGAGRDVREFRPKALFTGSFIADEFRFIQYGTRRTLSFAAGRSHARHMCSQTEREGGDVQALDLSPGFSDFGDYGCVRGGRVGRVVERSLWGGSCSV